MTRDEALNRYDRIRYNLLNSDDKAAVDVAFEALRGQGNCCKNGNSSWISVEERLPSLDATKTDDFGRQKSVRVLCVCKQKSGKVFVKEGYYVVWAGDDVYWRIPGSIDSVTHWMPLPEPPKGE